MAPIAAVNWSAGVFRSDNHDDILFVLSDQTGFGYFTNFGETRRKGLELGAHSQLGRVTIGAGYTFLSATYESEETVNGESNSTNDAAEDGEPGLEGSIEIVPGDRIPLIPRHMFKAYADIPLGSKLSLDVDLLAVSGSFARGNENNVHEPDGTYYLGSGFSARIRDREPGGRVSADAVDAACRAGHEPVRPQVLHGGTARAVWFHRHRLLHRAAPTRDQRRVPGSAGDVLRARRTREDVDRHAIQVLTADTSTLSSVGSRLRYPHGPVADIVQCGPSQRNSLIEDYLESRARDIAVSD